MLRHACTQRHQRVLTATSRKHRISQSITARSAAAMAQRRGCLFVFEGLDRAGKSTQVSLLKQYLSTSHRVRVSCSNHRIGFNLQQRSQTPGETRLRLVMGVASRTGATTPDARAGNSRRVEVSGSQLALWQNHTSVPGRRPRHGRSRHASAVQRKSVGEAVR